MTSQLARVGADGALNLSNLNESHIPGYIDRNEAIIHALTEPVTQERINDSEVEVSSSSSYILANDPSQLSRDVDRWITGSVTSTPNESTGVQGGRQTVTQRSTVTSSCMATDNIWYVVAMILPMFSVHNCVMTLRCTPSNMLNVLEIFLHNISRICAKLKVQIQRIARDQVSRDLFATGMDVLLIIYALGFLVLSMYQVTMIS